jgi:hypothetical protein
LLFAVAVLPAVVFLSLPWVLWLLTSVLLTDDVESIVHQFLHLLLIELTGDFLLARRLQTGVALVVTRVLSVVTAIIVARSSVTTTLSSSIAASPILTSVFSTMFASVLPFTTLTVLLLVGTFRTVTSVLGFVERLLLSLHFFLHNCCGDSCSLNLGLSNGLDFGLLGSLYHWGRGRNNWSRNFNLFLRFNDWCGYFYWLLFLWRLGNNGWGSHHFLLDFRLGCLYRCRSNHGNWCNHWLLLYWGNYNSLLLHFLGLDGLESGYRRIFLQGIAGELGIVVQLFDLANERSIFHISFDTLAET